jgi:hypothetical protein
MPDKDVTLAVFQLAMSRLKHCVGFEHIGQNPPLGADFGALQEYPLRHANMNSKLTTRATFQDPMF